MAVRGRVAIVGAGPGAPDLLTRRAVARLRSAELVLYDALVDPRVLDLATRARRFFVGKRAGRHAMSQTAIHALMIRAARRGRKVVRLKGGDPFVFGRGGEEAQALGAAGVPFEVVPGVTSAVAAPALAGIPVTCRGLASAFLVASGHDLDALDEVVAGVPPHRVTLVVLMGMAGRAAMAGRLVAAGWSLRTPAAVIVSASTPASREWRGTLGDLTRGLPSPLGDGPGTLVIGGVAALDCRDAIGAAKAAPDKETHACGQ